VAGQDKAILAECERRICGRANARNIIDVPSASRVAMLSNLQDRCQANRAAADETGEPFSRDVFLRWQFAGRA
jgi:hypothetical protein